MIKYCQCQQQKWQGWWWGWCCGTGLSVYCHKTHSTNGYRLVMSVSVSVSVSVRVWQTHQGQRNSSSNSNPYQVIQMDGWVDGSTDVGRQIDIGKCEASEQEKRNRQYKYVCIGNELASQAGRREYRRCRRVYQSSKEARRGMGSVFNPEFDVACYLP